MGVVLALGAVDLPLPVDAKEELLVGEQFSPAHVALEVVVAAPRVAPHHRCRRGVGRPGQPGGGGVRRRARRMRGEDVRRRPAGSMASSLGRGGQGGGSGGSQQEEEEDEGEGEEARRRREAAAGGEPGGRCTLGHCPSTHASGAGRAVEVLGGGGMLIWLQGAGARVGAAPPACLAAPPLRGDPNLTQAVETCRAAAAGAQVPPRWFPIQQLCRKAPPSMGAITSLPQTAAHLGRLLPPTSTSSGALPGPFFAEAESGPGALGGSWAAWGRWSPGGAHMLVLVRRSGGETQAWKPKTLLLLVSPRPTMEAPAHVPDSASLWLSLLLKPV